MFPDQIEKSVQSSISKKAYKILITYLFIFPNSQNILWADRKFELSNNNNNNKFQII